MGNVVGHGVQLDPHTGRAVRIPGVTYRVGNTLTRAEAHWLEEMRHSEFFLVRNDGAETGERWPCAPKLAAYRILQEALAQGEHDPMVLRQLRQRVMDAPEGCGNKHSYFTAFCVELPYRGLGNALNAYVQATHDEYARAKLYPFIPSLGRNGHREFSRRMRPRDPGTAFYAIALGYTEPITELRAQEFADAISTRAGQRITI